MPPLSIEKATSSVTRSSCANATTDAGVRPHRTKCKRSNFGNESSAAATVLQTSGTPSGSSVKTSICRDACPDSAAANARVTTGSCTSAAVAATYKRVRHKAWNGASRQSIDMTTPRYPRAAVLNTCSFGAARARAATARAFPTSCQLVDRQNSLRKLPPFAATTSSRASCVVAEHSSRFSNTSSPPARAAAPRSTASETGCRTPLARDRSRRVHRLRVAIAARHARHTSAARARVGRHEGEDVQRHGGGKRRKGEGARGAAPDAARLVSG